MAITATTLSAAIDSTQTTFNVASTTGITNPNYQTGAGITLLYIDSEMMLVTSVDTTNDVVNVVRGYNSTPAASHGASAPVLIGNAGTQTTLPDFNKFTPAQTTEVQSQNRFQGVSAPVAAASALAPSGPLFHVTGHTASSSVTLPSGWTETSFTVIADDTWTWTSATTPGSFAQAGAVTSAGSTVTFTYDAATGLWYASRNG